MERDIFDDVFGEDSELKKAREKQALEKKSKIENDRFSEFRDESNLIKKTEKGKILGDDDSEENPEEEKDFEGKENDFVEKDDFNKDALEAKEDSIYEGIPDSEKPLEKESRRKKKEEKNETKDKIKQIILKKAEESKENQDNGEIKPFLKMLQSKEGNFFMGRKKSVYEKWGERAGLFIGKVGEEQLKDKNVLLDSMNPHVVFVCGARGSGKSYVLGVIAEELALKNQEVGVIVIDPIGVFWSMKYPNKDKKELEKLAEWGLEPKGLNNLKVFVPEGIKDKIPATTYDKTFSIKPSLLTAEDWCLTFSIERFSPGGLLLEKVLQKTREGYIDKEGKKVKSKGINYTLQDLTDCLEKDSELTSSDKGYKPDSLRALASRFEAAKNWGIFDGKGTPLTELSKTKQLTIIDTSFLEDNVSALVIGLLARRLLSARKINTRKEKQDKPSLVDYDQLMEYEIPPTWLFIDEAHTLIPSGNVRTPASTAIVEYVKQGRQPGCSLVFATQQPSAIDTRVLSQLDVIMSHKLVFDDDIKAIYKRTPTIIPRNYKSSSFIKTLPVGVALTGDRTEETSRSFVIKVRPRMSQHEGRESDTAEITKRLSDDEVEALAIGMARKRISEQGYIELEALAKALDTLNSKYSAKGKLSNVKDALLLEGFVLSKDKTMIKKPEYEEEIAEYESMDDISKEIINESRKAKISGEDSLSLYAIPRLLTEDNAREIVEKIRKKKKFFVFGKNEDAESVSLKYFPLYHIKYKVLKKAGAFVSMSAYFDATKGEFIHFYNKSFVYSRGFSRLQDLKSPEVQILSILNGKEREQEAIEKEFGDEKLIKRILKNLSDKNLLSMQKHGNTVYFKPEFLDLPYSPSSSLLSSLDRMERIDVESLAVESPRYPKSMLIENLKKLWNKIDIIKIEELFIPVYEVVLKEKGNARILHIDAYSGTLL